MRPGRSMLVHLAVWLAALGPPVDMAAGQLPLLPPAQLRQVQQGVQAVYDLEHDRAAVLFQRMIRENPNDPVGHIFLAKTYWLQELGKKQELSIDRFASSDFFTESPKHMPKVSATVEARFRRVAAQAIAQARAKLDEKPDDPKALFLLGLAYQNVASYEASLKLAWWAAFRAGSKTYRYHRDLLRLQPEVYDAYLSTGTFHYVTGSLSWRTRWLPFVLGYRGSKERGRQELRATIDRGALMSHDARVLLTLIYTREKRFQDAFDELSILLKSSPKNYLVHLDMGGIAMLMERHEAALTIYKDILRKVEAKEDRYDRLEAAAVHNRLGVAFRRKGDLTASADWFRKSLGQEQAGEQTRIVTHLELAKTYDLLGRRGDATNHYREVLKHEDFAGSRDEARDFLQHPYRGK